MTFSVVLHRDFTVVPHLSGVISATSIFKNKGMTHLIFTLLDMLGYSLKFSLNMHKEALTFCRCFKMILLGMCFV